MDNVLKKQAFYKNSQLHGFSRGNPEIDKCRRIKVNGQTLFEILGILRCLKCVSSQINRVKTFLQDKENHNSWEIAHCPMKIF